MKILFNYVEEKDVERDNLIMIFGLAGDPPHAGHIQAIKYLLSFPESKVKVVLSAAHAFNKKLSPFRKRKEWLDILFKESFTEKECARIEISDIEEKILKEKPEGKVHSFDLVNHFTSLYSKDKVALAFGPDNANDETLMRFKKWIQLKEHDIIVIPEMKIKEKTSRSTQIRYLLIDKKESELKELIGENLARNLLDWVATKDGGEWLTQRKITV